MEFGLLMLPPILKSFLGKFTWMLYRLDGLFLVVVSIRDLPDQVLRGYLIFLVLASCWLQPHP